MARPPMFKPAEKQRIVLSVLRGECSVAEAARRSKCSSPAAARTCWRVVRGTTRCAAARATTGSTAATPQAADRQRPVVQVGGSTSPRVGARRRRVTLAATVSEPAQIDVSRFLTADGINTRLAPVSARIAVGGAGAALRVAIPRAAKRRVAADLRRPAPSDGAPHGLGGRPGRQHEPAAASDDLADLDPLKIVDASASWAVIHGGEAPRDSVDPGLGADAQARGPVAVTGGDAGGDRPLKRVDLARQSEPELTRLGRRRAGRNALGAVGR